ncbi:MAG TPA: beta-ketoacyl-[acyl-carrier-protein] synthase family protein [Dokdonella sp.]|uniref:beta-ketoacyl-[acyl-carrier-protein] synthase family protein n=1 Tax=Dokdonella sp. TaxID=2291710 RepID=UPI002D7F7E83|nr:beta-ketoacyl-[acyl-carrier-protein] synthase family protein [Dokdonella sp.]HET9033291.1 beta-ketoacyl-[acyl-carrier-protein] synthase family protein [Dokdonella sp.]
MPNPIDPIFISAYTATSALGRGLADHHTALHQGRSGLHRNDFTQVPLDCAIGRVAGLEQASLPEDFSAFECRNNRLAWLAIEADGFLDQARAAIARYGADRVALLAATSTSSIGTTEEAYANLDGDRMPRSSRRSAVHTPHSPGIFLEQVLGTRGPCLTTATACSSSAKIFAKAERMIRLGVVDAAILAGVDTLCGSVLFGFNSLELVAPQPCRPFDVRRCGISIGEAAGFALVERSGSARSARLIGWGESSDAHHMSTPHPEGLGAQLALEGALARAGLSANDVDYINLHGTATPKNDEVEAGVVVRAFNPRTRASSSKGWTGHTLGAAGILESVISLIAIEDGFIPGTLNCEQRDPVCGPQIALKNEVADVRIALSNSFGFGGSNCTLAFARAEQS